MPRITSNSINIIDVVDGSDPIVAFQTNPSHTFQAAQDGAVQATEFNAFSNLIYCYIGSDKADASIVTSDAAMPNSSFRLSASSGDGAPATVAGSGWPAGSSWEYSAEDDDALKFTTPNEGLNNATADTATVTLHIRIKNATGSVIAVDQNTTFTKALAGGDGDVITLTGTNNIFTANSSGTIDSGQDAITVQVDTQGSPGTQTYEVSVNGGAFVALTSTGAGAGQISGWDSDLSGEPETGTIGNTARRLFISGANLGNANDKYQLMVSGLSGGADTYNVVKIRDGAAGDNAITLNISSNRGNVFSATETGDKTLTATVYDQGSGSEITSGISYDWRLGAPDSTITVKVDASGNVVSSGGSPATGKTIIVDDDDVDGSQQYSCIVTTDT